MAFHAQLSESFSRSPLISTYGARRMMHRCTSSCLSVIVLIMLSVFATTPAIAAKSPKSVDMTGEWAINDTRTAEARESLPEPKKRSGFFSRLSKRVHVSVQVPGTPASVPLPGTGDDEETDNSRGSPLHDYGRVAVIKIRQRPDQFAVDYGNQRLSLLTPDETTTEKIDKRKITTKSGWRGDRYIVKKSADDGSTLSEEFELINDGTQLQWTVVDFPKGGFKVMDVAIYDRVDKQRADTGATTSQ